MLFSVCQFLFGERQVNGLRLAQRDCKWDVCIYFSHNVSLITLKIIISVTFVLRDLVFSERKSLKIYAVTGDNSAPSIYM